MATHSHVHQHIDEKLMTRVDKLPQGRASATIEVYKDHALQSSLTLYGGIDELNDALLDIMGELDNLKANNAAAENEPPDDETIQDMNAEAERDTRDGL